MTKQMLGKMLAGLSLDEQKAALTDMGITEATAQAEYLTLAATVNSAPITQPVVAPPAAPAQTVVEQTATQQPAAAPGAVNVQEILARLAAEKTARITAECSAFMAANASKITPAETGAVQQLFVQLASLDDPTALNQYMASITARPVNHMLQESVVSANAVVLQNTQAVDNRTEAEKDAAAITAMLGMTDVGQQSAHVMKTGKVSDGNTEKPINLGKAFEQFAVNAPAGV